MEASKVISILRIFDETKAREFYMGWFGFGIDWRPWNAISVTAVDPFMNRLAFNERL